MSSVTILLMAIAAIIGMIIGMASSSILGKSRKQNDVPTTKQGRIEPALQQSVQRPPTKAVRAGHEDEEQRKLATFSFASGNSSRGAFILEQFLKQAPPGKYPDCWIMLLDIYYGSGNRAQFDATSERYQASFSTTSPTFTEWKQNFPVMNGFEKTQPSLYAEIRRCETPTAAVAFIDTLIKDSSRPGRPLYNLTDALSLFRMRNDYANVTATTSTIATGTNNEQRPAVAPSVASAPNRPVAAPKTAATEELMISSSWAPNEKKSASDEMNISKKSIYTTGSNTQVPAIAATGQPSTANQVPAEPVVATLSFLEEKHPRIFNKISDQWPTMQCNAFLDSLIIDERGVRQGFSPDVMSEILFLKEIVDYYHPSIRDKWEGHVLK